MTTEELFDKYKEHVSLSEGQHDYLIDKEDFKEALLEFAKYHVQEAIKSIVKTEMSPDASQKIFEEDTKYVQAMYPLENIK